VFYSDETKVSREYLLKTGFRLDKCHVSTSSGDRQIDGQEEEEVK
jgi:hypothetical protein